jgi:hypothetical protein
MKNISTLNSKDLLSKTRSLVAEERRATLALIQHLEEISRRKLYAELGYASLWEFTTRELGLSEGAAQRRIQAMRLLRDVPEALPRERERIISATEERELKWVVSPELYEKLQRLKGFWAHAMPEATYAQLIERMTDEVLARVEKNKGVSQIAVDSDNNANTAAAAVNATTATRPLPVGKRVYLPAILRKAVWARSSGRCEFSIAGQRCTSQYRLEVDHAKPLALGGSNEFNNLRILCREHNAYEAIRKIA